MAQLFFSLRRAKNWVILTQKFDQILVKPVTQLLGSKWLNFFSRCTEWKIESFWRTKLGRILIPPVTQLFKSKWINFFSRCSDRKNWVILSQKVESFELRQKHLNKKKVYSIGYPTGNGQSSIIAKAVNKQNASKLLRYKLYFKMI